MFQILGYMVYIALGVVAIWGAFCVVMVQMRIRQKRFNNEAEQAMFLEAVEQPLSRGEYNTASEICEGDLRAVCQLSQLAIDNRALGYAKIKQLVGDRFQRDILTDLEHRVSWIVTVIKAAPMLGLLGTVMGMMGAFQKIAGTESGVDPTALAGDISFALITTAVGLSIAIPLVICVASINVQIKRLEDLVSYGLNQFLEIFREAIIRHPR